MAIDTRLKRQSAHMVMIPHPGGVHPAGVNNKAQRIMSAWGYGGVEAADPAEESGSRISNIFAGGVVQ